jgi:tetratricopeptide (TPR) repeat protein
MEASDAGGNDMTGETEHVYNEQETPQQEEGPTAKAAPPPQAEETPASGEAILAPVSEPRQEQHKGRLPARVRGEEESQPHRGGPPWPPAVALLNLTGLGLGYLRMKRWLRWVIHLLLTAGLIATVFLTNGARLRGLWAVVLGLWLLWMGFDGWLQARRVARAAPPEAAGRRWLPAALGVLLLVLEAAALWGYAALGQREFAAGMTAYWAADCRTAMRHFHRVTTLYELTLSPNVAAADAGIVECSHLVLAENAWRQGEYAEAVDGYEAYLRLYPESVLLISVRGALAEAYGDWATRLRQAQDHQAAIDKYQVVLSDYPETSTGKQAAALAAETYAEWAEQLRGEAKYGAAIEKHLIVLNDYPGTPGGEKAAALAAETYAEWAIHVREDGEYGEAIEKYQAILGEYPQTPAAAEARQAAAETYAEWAAELRRVGEYGLAIEKYQAILGEYRTTPPAARAEAEMAETYAEWAAQLRKTGRYATAIAKYEIILDEYPDTQPAHTTQAVIGQAYNEWGRQLHSQRKYIEAMDKFTLSKGATDDPEVLAAAEEGYDEALWGLSQDSTGQGKGVMKQTLPDVCDGKPADSPAVGLAEDEPGKALFDGSEFALPDELKATDPGHFRYAVCLEAGTRVVQRCPYTGGHTLVRQRQWWRVRVRDARTARVVADRTFNGSSPAACPFSRVFWATVDYTTGDPPSADQVINWLRGVVR